MIRDWRTVRHRLADGGDDDLCALCRGASDDPIHRGFTLEDGVDAAVARAARDRAGSFAVYVVDGGKTVADIIVQDARAVAPCPRGPECIAQFWLERGDVVEVQIRRARASSEWRNVEKTGEGP